MIDKTLPTDCGNSAFVLSDKNVRFNRKVMFVLSRKWCWSLLILFIALIAFPYLIVTYRWAKDLIIGEDKQRDRSSWDALPALPGLEPLNTPILRVVVTQTYEHINRSDSEIQIDDRKRCTTEVSL